MMQFLTNETEQEVTRFPLVSLLFLKVPDDAGSSLPTIYQELTPDLMEQQPSWQLSLLAKTLDAQDKETYLIASHWANQDAYRAWESNDEHRTELRPLVRQTSGLRAETFVCVG